MSLLHALVSHDKTILAESRGHSNDDPEAGNTFSHATSTILAKIPPNDSKLSYQADEYLFHYIRQGPVTVLAMAEQELPRRVAFGFLNELLKRFTSTYSRDEILDSEPYGLSAFSATITQLMDQFVNDPPPDPVKQAQEEIAGVKAIMVQNVEQILSRGERIELLVDKTDNMSHQARAFRKRSQALRRRMWWKNTKLLALGGLLALIILFILISSARPNRQ